MSAGSRSHLECSSLGHCQMSEGFSSRSQKRLMWIKCKGLHVQEVREGNNSLQHETRDEWEEMQEQVTQ